MKVDPVPSPVILKNSGELWEVGVDRFFQREGIRDGVIPSLTAGARRPRRVFEYREILDGADRAAQENGDGGEAEARECVRALPRRGGRRDRVTDRRTALRRKRGWTHRHEQREGAGRQQHVLQQLRVR